jgi:hypothetical protein
MLKMGPGSARDIEQEASTRQPILDDPVNLVRLPRVVLGPKTKS